jgi:hypothetical protein
MTIQPITPLVQPHGLIVIDSDADNYDRCRDDITVPDPYQTDWVPMYSHGLVFPEEPRTGKEDR